jgi:hypothetical protein
MNLKDILAITGEGTLFKFIAQGKNAVIVENLETGRRFTAGGTARVSTLEEISIFTSGEDMPLGKVMDMIWEKENGGETISHKLRDDELKMYFAEILPEYDRNRVYTSDIRKVFHWYNILHQKNLLVKEEEKKEVEEKAEETEAAAKAEKGDESNNAKEKGKERLKKAAVTAEAKKAPAKKSVKKKTAGNK